MSRPGEKSDFASIDRHYDSSCSPDCFLHHLLPCTILLSARPYPGRQEPSCENSRIILFHLQWARAFAFAKLAILVQIRPGSPVHGEMGLDPAPLNSPCSDRVRPCRNSASKRLRPPIEMEDRSKRCLEHQRTNSYSHYSLTKSDIDGNAREEHRLSGGSHCQRVWSFLPNRGHCGIDCFRTVRFEGAGTPPFERTVTEAVAAAGIALWDGGDHADPHLERTGPQGSRRSPSF